MKNPLSALEARVIGCFLEKQVTTPDQYPLSLNGLTTACNQKTNREPVMDQRVRRPVHVGFIDEEASGALVKHSGQSRDEI